MASLPNHPWPFSSKSKTHISFFLLFPVPANGFSFKPKTFLFQTTHDPSLSNPKPKKEKKKKKKKKEE